MGRPGKNRALESGRDKIIIVHSQGILYLLLTGYIGTGTTDIVEKCIAAGLPTPEYKQDSEFKIVIWRKRSNVNEPQNEPQKSPLSKVQIRYRKLIETIISNPYISRDELSKELGVRLATIKRDISDLRNSYRIEWIGPSKSGRWEIEKL